MTSVNNQTQLKKSTSGRGGIRPGSGRPKGSVSEARKAQLKAEATLRELAAEHTEDALQTLVSLYKDTATPPAARVAAIKEILDRGHGKPPQTVVGDPEQPLEMRVTRIELVGPDYRPN